MANTVGSQIGPLQLCVLGFLVAMTLTGLYLTNKGDRIPVPVMIGFLGGMCLVVAGAFQSFGLMGSKPEPVEEIDPFEKKKERQDRKLKKKQEAEYEKEKQAEAERAAKAVRQAAAKKEQKLAKAAAKLAEEQKKEAPVADEKKGGKKKKKKPAAKKDGEKKDAEPAKKAEEKDNQGWVLQPIKKDLRAAKKSGDGPQLTVEVSVASKHYTAILGNKGATLAKIEEEFNVKLTVPKRDSTSQKIKFVGTEAGIESAKQCIYEICDKGYSKALDKNQTDTTMEVKNLGLLIGPNGSNIKTIQSKSGARINLPGKPAAGEERNKTITILGDTEAVRTAQAAITQLMNDGYSDLTHENWRKITLHFPASMTAMLLGPKGSKIQAIQERTGTRINVPDGKGKDGDAKTLVDITILGPMQGVEEARRAISAVQTDFLTRESDFPAVMLSALIGTGGANIKRIQKETNTRIDIGDHLWDPSMKCITISGFDRDIKAVEQELSRVLASNTQWRIDFPAERVGIFFGKGGEGIRKLQQDTNTRINVANHEWDDLVKEVTVVGPIAGVAEARAVIEASAVERPKKAKQNSDDEAHSGEEVEEEKPKPAKKEQKRRPRNEASPKPVAAE